jgi:hypothetical protein
MGRMVQILFLASVLPALGVVAYYCVPEFQSFIDKSLFGGPSLIRYVDGQGRQFYVSSMSAVPVEYRKKAEINPQLPSVNRGEFQPPIIPFPSEPRVQRGGDAVILDKYESTQRAETIDFDDDRLKEPFWKNGTPLEKMIPELKNARR